MIARFATSLPGSIPSGTVRARPIVPADAILSIQGVFAAFNGVWPPNSGTGQSAIPSGTRIKYFVSESEDIQHLLHIGFAGYRLSRYFDSVIRVLEPVPGKCTNNSVSLTEKPFLALLYHPCNGSGRGRFAEHPGR